MKRWFIILAILILVLFLIILSRGREPFGGKNSNFSIDWTDEVQSITILEDGKRVILERVGEGWIVNQVPARNSAIDFILTTLHTMEIKSPVSEDIFKNSEDPDSAEPTEVIINGKGNKRERFFIYKSYSHQLGSILKRSKTSKPYIVSVPGYDTDPGSHFVIDERFWTPYQIFNLHPNTIKSIEVYFSDLDLLDFKIALDQLEMKLVYDGYDGYDGSEVDKASIERYISYFSYVPFENWEFGLESTMKNEIVASDPEMTFIVNITDGSEIILKLWLKYIETPEGIIFDTDRLYGSLNNGMDLFIVKYFDLDPLIKTVDYFRMD